MDYKQAIGEGIIGAGSALLVGGVLLLCRWLWIGLRSDLGRLFGGRREGGKVPYHLQRIKPEVRVEPKIRR